jgi:hypothetical protein
MPNALRFVIDGRTLHEWVRVANARVRTVAAGRARGPCSEQFIIGPRTANRPTAARVAIATTTHPEVLPAVLHSAIREPCDAALAIGIGPARGHCAGGLLLHGNFVPAEAVTVIGPAWQRVCAPRPTTAEEREMWLRSRGSFGSDHAWNAIRGLNLAVIGCGRSGSLAAFALRQLGVRGLTLIDPDTLELHNLGESVLMSREDVGSRKAEALAARLEPRTATDQPVVAVPHSIATLNALSHIKDVDLLICTVDNALARLTSTFLATVYMKPLLDIGTGVFDTSRAQSRRMGADVRLIVPGGTGGCLLCAGGVGASPAPREPNADFTTERAGSSFTLNGTAVFLGLRLLEDFVTGRSPGSHWLRCDFTPSGEPRLTNNTFTHSPACPLCRLTGLGDEAIQHYSAICKTTAFRSTSS